jgi:hypothetical protein
VWDGSRFTLIARQSTPASADADCATINEPAASAATSSATSEAPATPAAQAAGEPQQSAEQSTQHAAAEAAAEQVRRENFAQQAQQRSGIDAAAGQMIVDGQACFDRKDYTCAITNATDALRIKPDFAAAKSLRSSAQTAQSQAMNSIDIH